jgi:hypothetical protein
MQDGGVMDYGTGKKRTERKMSRLTTRRDKSYEKEHKATQSGDTKKAAKHAKRGNRAEDKAVKVQNKATGKDYSFIRASEKQTAQAGTSPSEFGRKHDRLRKRSSKLEDKAMNFPGEKRVSEKRSHRLIKRSARKRSKASDIRVASGYTRNRAGGKKKAQLGGILGAIGGAKGAGGGFGKKLFGAAKGLIGGGLGGRIAGGVGSMMKGGKFGEGFKGGLFGNSNPMGGGGNQAQAQGQGSGTQLTPDQTAEIQNQQTEKMGMRKGGNKDRRKKQSGGWKAQRARRKSAKSAKKNPMGGSRRRAHTRGKRNPIGGGMKST